MASEKKLHKLVTEKHEFDKESQAFIDSLVHVSAEIDSLESMKRTQGWKVLEKKLREELKARILLLVKEDKTVQTLIALLTVTDTKSAMRTLEGEIEKALPE